jgi:hypothetical protein
VGREFERASSVHELVYNSWYLMSSSKYGNRHGLQKAKAQSVGTRGCN